MRSLLTGLVVSAIVALVPMSAMADNQQLADRIADNLQKSGQLSSYKIAVKYQNGTAWLKGKVRDQQQMSAALRTAFRTDGVNRVVNRMKIDSSLAAKQPAKQKTTLMAKRRPSRLSSGAITQQRMQLAATGPVVVPVALLQQTPQRQMRQAPQRQMRQAPQRPIPVAYMQNGVMAPAMQAQGRPVPMYTQASPGVAPARYDQPCMPNYSWPSYAAHPNYAAVTYPKQYSPTAWPFIGPFYPYPQVPLGWRKVTLEWDDGWWMLDFKDSSRCRFH